MNNTCINAEIIEVIRVLSTEGNGSSPQDSIKEVVQYWTKDGEFLFKLENN